MIRPRELRTPPRDWLDVLRVAYPFLRQRGLGDLLVYGSQALSIYLENPLRSKDLDLVSSQIGPREHEAVARELATRGMEVRSTTIQSHPLSWGNLKTYSVELRLSGRPFILEIFDRILDGRPTSLLTPEVQHVKRWGLDLWVPSADAILALRLCFRRPEGISRLNAVRLNRFIQENTRKLHPRRVQGIISQWEMGPLVRDNLEDLHRRHRMRMLQEEKLLSKVLKDQGSP